MHPDERLRLERLGDALTNRRSRPSSDTRAVAAVSAVGHWLRYDDDFVNDARNRCGRVDYNSVLRNVFFRLMPSRNEFPFSWKSAAPFIVRSRVKPPIQ